MSIESKIRMIEDYEAQAKHYQQMADELKDGIKADMIANELTEILTEAGIVRFCEYVSNRFDTTAFKKKYADLYASYTKQSTARRFSITH